MFDFANILFSGPCNARCPFCIGQQIDPALNKNNLHEFPPKNLAVFMALIQAHAIQQVVLSGTNTDPQLYSHEAQLIQMVREQTAPGTQLSLHTNGRQALQKMEVFNCYDRVTLSLPSFNPKTYRKIMGVPNPPDLQAILNASTVPIKISCVLTEHNLPEVPDFLENCHQLGIRRLVLRKLYGDVRPWERLIQNREFNNLPHTTYRSNRVFDYHGMQITLWDFSTTQSRSINLFSTGVISETYLLSEAKADSSITYPARNSPPTARHRIGPPTPLHQSSQMLVPGDTHHSHRSLDRCGSRVGAPLPM
jgi:hypothetical protein